MSSPNNHKRNFSRLKHGFKILTQDSVQSSLHHHLFTTGLFKSCNILQIPWEAGHGGVRGTPSTALGLKGGFSFC